MPFKETIKGQTQFCPECEFEARHNIKSNLRHICGKENEQEQVPEGVSQWREYGKKFQYWNFFEKGIRADERKKISKMIEKEFDALLINPSLEDDIAIQVLGKILVKIIIG